MVDLEGAFLAGIEAAQVLVGNPGPGKLRCDFLCMDELVIRDADIGAAENDQMAAILGFPAAGVLSRPVVIVHEQVALDDRIVRIAQREPRDIVVVNTVGVVDVISGHAHPRRCVDPGATATPKGQGCRLPPRRRCGEICAASSIIAVLDELAGVSYAAGARRSGRPSTKRGHGPVSPISWHQYR
jgi:hypothetical protein